MAVGQARLLPGAALAPAGVTATPVATGGTYTAGTYYFAVTFVTDWGETEFGEAHCTVVLDGSVTLAWTLPATGPPVRQVNIYRGTSAQGTGAESLLCQSIMPAAGSTVVTATGATDTSTTLASATPPVTTTFSPTSIDADSRVLDTDTTIASLPTAAQQLQAIAAAEEWINSSGTSQDAQNNANAAGIMLEWA